MKITRFLICWIFIITNIVYASDLEIKNSSDDGLTVEFSPQNWQIDKRTIDDKSYHEIAFAKNDFTTKPGEPMAPCRIIMVGIPLDADVDYQIIDLKPGTKIAGRLIPTPVYYPLKDYDEHPEIYRQSQEFPPNIIQMDKPGFIRNQRVICIKIYPLQFNPQLNEIQLINKITIRINFKNMTNYGSSSQFNQDESTYDGVIINYEQAKKWRKPYHKKLEFKKSTTSSRYWYKIFIEKEGIYKITGKMLKDYGIDITSINPGNIKIFNNGGRELPRDLYTVRPDSLIENAILVNDNNDRRFDETDYILFYGISVNNWYHYDQNDIFSHYINHYTDVNVYWLTWDEENAGKRMKNVNLQYNDQWPLVTTFQDQLFLEEDLNNPIESGIDWYGKAFFVNEKNGSDSKTFPFHINKPVVSDSIYFKILLASKSGGTHNFDVYMNNKYIGRRSFYSSPTKYITLTTKFFEQKVTNVLIDGFNLLKIEYTPNWTNGEAYLDWIELHLRRKLAAYENTLQFYASDVPGGYRYQLTNFSSDEIYIFDITNFHNAKLFSNIQKADTTFVFADTTNTVHSKKYIALTADKFMNPLKIEKDVNSDLRVNSHQADFIIITHDDFYDQALSLKSLRENCDNLRTKVVKISDVYDEFSWGLFDPVAIRDFIKYAFENWAIQPRYVLLFGSGDFDYRNIIDEIDHNKIPPFETREKYEGDSRAWDDWYVCVSGEDDYVDLSLGRLPIRTPEHASAVVRKIIDYKNTPFWGDWRNTITMVADDVYGETNWGIEREHTEEAEMIVENYIPKSFTVNKIYLVEYPPVYTASITGVRKPAAQNDIVESINRGTLIINYVGHGRYDLWAHEVVLDMAQDLPRLNTGPKQALWIAGTCYFGRFDNPAYESMAEELVLLENNGAIAVIAASRLVGSSPNVAFNKRFYQELFPSAYSKVRLGDAVVKTKNSRGNEENDQKIILFADPTMHLSNPSYKAYIKDIRPDTIKALSRLIISGEVQQNGVLWEDFDGKVLLKGYDSRKYRTYPLEESNDIGYWLPGNTIFRGTASINQGKFDIKFIVPKDITYGGEDGRFNLYFWNDDVDGSSFKNLIPVGGTETNILDDKGPQIALQFNDADFESGGFTTENPKISIEITDSLSGVNITGDIGHSIILTLDGEKVNVTDLFHYYRDNYLSGSVEYNPGILGDGPHELKIKAWDNSNNSSELKAEFNVVAGNKPVVEKLMNYPNPFKRGTEITFWTNQTCDASIKIYTIAGRLIKKIDHLFAEIGFNHFYWDGNDEDGNSLANGVYLYKVQTRAQHNGKSVSAEAIQKLMIMR